MARLVIFDEAVRGVDLPDRPVVLGRSRHADIPIRDHLLSRKHCSIVPEAEGLRLIDLKSSNGTFLNGNRVDRSPLKSDDVIEIGNTVIVLLNTGSWRGGASLPRLRNAGKARDLIRVLEKKRGRLPGGPVPLKRTRRGTRPAARGRKSAARGKGPSPAEAEFLKWAKKEFLSQPAARQLLAEAVERQLAALVIRNAKELRSLVASTLEKVLSPEALAGDLAQVRARIAAALEAELGVRARAREDEANADTPTEGAS